MIPVRALAPFPTERLRPCVEAPTPAAWRWRALGDADLPWLQALYASTRQEELQAVPWPDLAKQQFLAQQFAAQHQHYLQHHPQAHYLAVEKDEQAIGRVYLDPTGADDLLIYISLLPHCQGNGLGSAMIRCLQQASAARRRALCLHVQIHNPGARRLYERLGFIASDASGSSLHVAMRWNPLA